LLTHVAGPELFGKDEGTGVDIASRVNAADDSASPAHVQTIERLTKSRKVEKGVSG
jgi:hypothetical protein